VGGRLLVKLEKVSTIVREHDPVQFNGTGKNQVVRHAVTGKIFVRARDHIVPHFTQAFGDLMGKMFVG